MAAIRRNLASAATSACYCRSTRDRAGLGSVSVCLLEWAGEPTEMKKSSSHTVWGRPLSIVAFIIAFVVTGLVVRHFLASNDPSAPVSVTSWRTYNSTRYGFSQSFPGNPTVTNSSVKLNGRHAPVTTYESDIADSSFDTAIVTYPPRFHMSNKRARLKGALNGSVQNVEGATLVSSSFTHLAGHKAITGILSVTQGSKTIEEYETAFLKGHKMFVLLATGASTHDSRVFTKSFKFTR